MVISTSKSQKMNLRDTALLQGISATRRIIWCYGVGKVYGVIITNIHCFKLVNVRHE